MYPPHTLSLFLSPVPIDATQGLKMLYVFVDIKIDTFHFLETIRFNFAAGTSLALVSTIQFVSTVQVRWGPQQCRAWDEACVFPCLGPVLVPPCPGSRAGAAAPGCRW